MSAWTNGTYTQKGRSLLAKLTQGRSLNITRAATGTGYVSPTALENQTTISGIKQNLLFMEASYPETGVCKIPVFLTNKGLTTGYKARQIGIYALDPDEGEILYFIAQSEEGTNVSSESTMPDYSATWTFYFSYGQADNVSVNVDPSHTVTPDMLKEVRVIAELGVSTPKIGTVLSLENTANLPFANLKLYGKSTQAKTTGKNLLNNEFYALTTNGLTFTVNDDKSILVNGTASVGTFLTVGTFDQPAGDYILSGCPSSGGTDTYLLYMTGDDYYVQDAGKGGTKFSHSGAIVPTVRLAIYEGATLNNVLLEPMIRLASVEDNSYEPYTGEEPSPSPDYPQEIVNIGDSGSVTIEVYGKNLLQHTIGDMTYNGLTVTVNNDKSITINGTPTDNVFFGVKNGMLIPAGDYILSGCPNGGSGETFMLYIVENGRYVQDSGKGALFSYPEDRTVDIRLSIYKAGGAINNLTFYPMIRQANIEDATYEAPTKQSIALTTTDGMPGIPVSKNGNFRDKNGQEWICDEIDLARGVYVRRVKTETVTLSYDDINDRYSATLTETMKADCGTEVSVPVLCNQLPYDPLAGNGTPKVNGIRGAATSPKYIIAYYNGEELGQVIVSYPLATPIETALTPDEITSFNDLVSNNPHTTIINDGGVPMEADCFLAQHEAAFKRVFTKTAPAYTYGTTDITAGETALKTGKMYLVYE